MNAYPDPAAKATLLPLEHLTAIGKLLPSGAMIIGGVYAAAGTAATHTDTSRQIWTSKSFMLPMTTQFILRWSIMWVRGITKLQAMSSPDLGSACQSNKNYTLVSSRVSKQDGGIMSASRPSLPQGIALERGRVVVDASLTLIQLLPGVVLISRPGRARPAKKQMGPPAPQSPTGWAACSCSGKGAKGSCEVTTEPHPTPARSHFAVSRAAARDLVAWMSVSGPKLLRSRVQ